MISRKEGKKKEIKKELIAQVVGVVQYTDFISAEGQDPPHRHRHQ